MYPLTSQRGDGGCEKGRGRKQFGCFQEYNQKRTEKKRIERKETYPDIGNPFARQLEAVLANFVWHTRLEAQFLQLSHISLQIDLYRLR